MRVRVRVRAHRVFPPRLGNGVRKANGRTPTNRGGVRVRSPLCGFPLWEVSTQTGSFAQQAPDWWRRNMWHKYHFLGCPIMEYYGHRTCIARSAPSTNDLVVSRKKRYHTCCQLLCGRGIEVETPPPLCCKLLCGRGIEAQTPPPQKHGHYLVLRVLRVASYSASGLRVAHSARVARSQRCCLWSLNVRVPCYADTPLFEDAISHESLCGCTLPGGLCSKYRTCSPVRTN